MRPGELRKLARGSCAPGTETPGLRGGRPGVGNSGAGDYFEAET